MQLSETETKRAVWLQRRLKFLRWWNKVGVFLCRWKSSPADQEAKWKEELQLLYNKKFKTPEPEQAFKSTFGNPLHRTPRNAPEDKQFMDMFTALFGCKKGK